MQTLIEYMKIHLISLEQDQADVFAQMEAMDPNCKDYLELDFEYNHLGGQILSVRHILSVANEMVA